MHPRHIRRKPAALAALTILALGAFVGTAGAGLTWTSGASQLEMDNRGDTVTQSTSSSVWTKLAGSNIALKVPQPRLVNARFTAESKCFGGPSTGWCAVRIVAINTTTGTMVELDPASGLGFAFDDVTSFAQTEAHAMERSGRLTPGEYLLRVEFAVTNATSTFDLSDWHFAVEMSA
jgi:hypothetical protein